jgi:hypothetical protein
MRKDRDRTAGFTDEEGDRRDDYNPNTGKTLETRGRSMVN